MVYELRLTALGMLGTSCRAKRIDESVSLTGRQPKLNIDTRRRSDPRRTRWFSGIAPSKSNQDRLDKGLVDVGLLLEPIDVEKYDFVRLSQKDTWGILMRDDHPLAEKSFITAEEIVEYPLILPMREKIRSEILNWLKRDEKDLRIPLNYTLLSNAALLVEEGLGCAFCMDGALAIRSSPHLRFVPFCPERTTRSVLVWKKNRLFSSATSLFIQEINMLRAKME